MTKKNQLEAYSGSDNPFIKAARAAKAAADAKQRAAELAADLHARHPRATIVVIVPPQADCPCVGRAPRCTCACD